MIEPLLVLATFSTSVATVIALIFVYKQMRFTSNAVTIAKDEATLRLRPWVGLGWGGDILKISNEIILKDGTRMLEDEAITRVRSDPRFADKFLTIRFNTSYKNYGLLPALHVIKRSKTIIDRIPELADLSDIKDPSKVALMPQETLPLMFDVPMEIKKRVDIGEIKAYTIFRIDYDYVGGKGFHEIVLEIKADGLDLMSANAE